MAYKGYKGLKNKPENYPHFVDREGGGEGGS